MTTDITYNQRLFPIGSLQLDQLQLPHDGDQEIYLVRQFHTTSKGFVNRGYRKKNTHCYFN
jgi:hypothetical protein